MHINLTYKRNEKAENVTQKICEEEKNILLSHDDITSGKNCKKNELQVEKIEKNFQKKYLELFQV